MQEPTVELAVQTLREAGFDDRQAQAIASMTGGGASSRGLDGDVENLERDVETLKEASVRTDAFDGFREEVVARTEASEERVKGSVVELGGRMDREFTAVRGEVAELGVHTNGEFTAVRGEVTKLRAHMDGEFTAVRGEIAELRAHMDGGFTAVRGEIAELRARMDGEFKAVRTEIRGIESRLKLVIGFLGAGLTLYAGTTVSLMILLFRTTAG